MEPLTKEELVSGNIYEYGFHVWDVVDDVLMPVDDWLGDGDERLAGEAIIAFRRTKITTELFIVRDRIKDCINICALATEAELESGRFNNLDVVVVGVDIIKLRRRRCSEIK